jgi:energy-coupling factor transporter ATP-binding protein EcfA2
MNVVLALWRALPGGVRWIVAAIGAYFLATLFMGAAGLVLILAVAAWAFVIAGYLYRAGQVAFPATARSVLAWFTADRSAPVATPGSPATAPAPPPPPALTATQREALKEHSIRKIDALHGQHAVKQRVAQLADVASASAARGEKGLGVGAPVQMVMFLGPEGTGKTKIAEAFAGLLCGVGACAENKIVELRRRDVTDAGPGKASAIVEQHAEAAVGGVLLIEDGEWLARGSDDPDYPFAAEVGKALVDVGVQHPGELILLVTGGTDLRSRVAERASLRAPWLNKTHVEIIEIEALGEDELVAAFMGMLKDRSVRAGDDVQAEARQVLKKKMGSRDFANIHTVRELVDKAISLARIRSASRDILLVASDVRNAWE